jgi:hypothetical protein
MRFWVVLLLFGLVLTHSMHRARAEDDDDSAAVEDDDEDYDGDSDRAHLVVRKSLSTDLGVQGRNITFTIELYNAGKRWVQCFAQSRPTTWGSWLQGYQRHTARVVPAALPRRSS